MAWFWATGTSLLSSESLNKIISRKINFLRKRADLISGCIKLHSCFKNTVSFYSIIYDVFTIILGGGDGSRANLWKA